MSARHITAVVLLSGPTTAATHDALRTALAGQSRRPDRTVVVAPSVLDEEVRAHVEEQRASGEIDEVLEISGTVSRAGAVREALELLAPHPSAVPSSTPERRGRGRGRRARAVDAEAVERERTQQAEDLAQVPERLRTGSQRTGRRIGAPEGGADESWLWFVVDGSTPGLDALERQLETLDLSPNTAVVGAKRVRHAEDDEDAPLTAESADALVDVGLTLTHGGRIISGVDPGEIDQGQADWRQDVLGVPLPGMLIRDRTLRESGGLDPDLPAPWAEVDLCRRVWRSGERVAVQASARVLHPHPTRPLLERLQEQRTGQLLALLKQRSSLHALLTLILLPLETLLRMAGAIAASAPSLALMELRAAAAVAPRARRVLARARRERRQARVPRGRLAPLYLPRSEGIRRWVDDTWTRLFADDDRQRRIRRTTWGIAGTRHGIEDADYGRHIVWTGTVALVATVLGLVTLRSLFGRGELAGPALRTLPDSFADRWQAAWADWVPGGLGERGPGDALIRLLGHIPLSGDLIVESLFFAAVPASALLAWWASGALTRAVGARLVLATAWALAPAMLGALVLGAWPLLPAHALMPLLALAVGRAIGLPHKVSQASVSAAAAGGLVLLVIGAVQPVLVLLAAAALALLAPIVPGRRKRLLWVLLPSLALHAPYVPVYLGHPEMLLAVAGVPAGAMTGAGAGSWELVPGLTEMLTPHVGATPAALLPFLPIAPVVLGALAAPFLAGAAGRVGRYGLVLAALGAGVLLLARGTWTAVDGHVLVHPAVHGLRGAVLLALSLGAAASFDALARREAHDTRARRAATSVVGGVIALACLTAVGGWAVLLPGQLQLERVTGGEVPAAAADQGRTDARTRVLVLAAAEDGAVDSHLVVHGGDSVLQHATIADARDVATVEAGEPVDGDPGSNALREAVATLLTSATPAEDAPTLTTLAVSYVVVPAEAGDQTELLHTLDSSTQLEKVTQGATGSLWRVLDASPRAAVIGGETPVALASGAVDVTGTLPAEDTERTLVLAERADSRWVATLDGTALESVEVEGWAQGFTVPTGASGEIEVHREQPLRLLWQVLLYAATGLTALISIPWRVRPRTVEAMYG